MGTTARLEMGQEVIDSHVKKRSVFQRCALTKDMMGRGLMAHRSKCMLSYAV